MALVLFALPAPLHACLRPDAAESASCCCATTTADTATCCTGNNLADQPAPTCCYTATDLPVAMPLPARDHTQPPVEVILAHAESVASIAHPTSPSHPTAIAYPTPGARRHLVLCRMLL
ncbi:MAG TPA: hypothetical protein PKC67_04185 [Kiritimatiellia bacterium]|nr:hypothetical protein [Kiritimatiellia bacterium]